MPFTSSSSSSSKRIEEWISRMSLDEIIGQMSQIDLNMLLQDAELDADADADAEPDAAHASRKILNLTKVDYYIGQLGIGSVLNNVVNHHWNASQYRTAIVQLQQAALKHNHPPVIYGLDSIHGANYIHGATLVPQPLNLAATFDPSMANRAGVVASRDTRAAGISWLFSPLLGIALNSYWGRVYETFGEDPYLVGIMGLELIRGIQQKSNTANSIPSRAAASAKHFVGYSMPHNGHDRAPSWIPTRHLYQYFIPPWKRVLQETLTVMEDYTEYDGVPTVGNRHSLTTLLRFQLGFEGMVVTDYAEIWNLIDWHHAEATRNDAIVTALSAGVDMSMIPFDAEAFYSGVHSALDAQQLSLDQLRQHARRVLEVKEALGMLDEIVTMENNDDIDKVGTDRDEALEMASQSIAMVKNDGSVLPLSSNDKLHVLVTGPTADSLSFQSGGWTWQWQGPDSKEAEREYFTYGTTVLEAAKELPWVVSYQCGVDILGQDCSNVDQPETVKDTVENWLGLNGNVPESIQKASEQVADYIIVCIGEENYTEKPGDINDLDLPYGQTLLVQQLRSKRKNAKIILVYFGGRPRLLRDMEPHVDAILIGFLPGPDAGRAMVNILSGSTNPSGRLPMTYPKYPDLQGVPYFHAVSDQCTTGDGIMPHYQYAPCQVQWPFGHGMSFTTFEYSNLAVSSETIHYSAPGQHKGLFHGRTDNDSVTISVLVTNTGTIGGYESVLFFTFDLFRSATPEYKRLRAFDKIYLEPGESRTVTKTLSMDDLRFVGPNDDSHYIVQDGLKFTVGVGPWTDCRDRPQDCSPPITVVAGDDYIAACDAACHIWSKTACPMSASDCWNLCRAASDSGPVKEGWGWPYVRCIESVAASPSDCSKMTTHCRDIFATQSSFPLPSTAATVAALSTGLLTALTIFLAVRGYLLRIMSKFSFRSDVPLESIEFQPVEQTADTIASDDDEDNDKDEEEARKIN